MASYHLSVKVISRAAGRTATAAAAYRAGEKIKDERTGEIHDYRRRGGVIFRDLALPADSPKWATDRCELWNRAEQAEVRKNSTVGREFELALPHELSRERQVQLARNFAREIVERHQCAVDIAVHEPHRRDHDNRNVHTHLLLTTRRISPEGFGPKTRELDDLKTGEVNYWRERWAKMQNQALREAGKTDRVDHRSLKDQGLDRLPTQHLGPGASAIERRHQYTDRGNANREAIVLNGEREMVRANIISLATEREKLMQQKQQAEAADQSQATAKTEALTKAKLEAEILAKPSQPNREHAAVVPSQSVALVPQLIKAEQPKPDKPEPKQPAQPERRQEVPKPPQDPRTGDQAHVELMKTKHAREAEQKRLHLLECERAKRAAAAQTVEWNAYAAVQIEKIKDRIKQAKEAREDYLRRRGAWQLTKDFVGHMAGIRTRADAMNKAVSKQQARLKKYEEGNKDWIAQQLKSARYLELRRFRREEIQAQIRDDGAKLPGLDREIEAAKRQVEAHVRREQELQARRDELYEQEREKAARDKSQDKPQQRDRGMELAP